MLCMIHAEEIGSLDCLGLHSHLRIIKAVSCLVRNNSLNGSYSTR